jgi:cellobiose-specific phosphotransferase system component IIC
MGKIGSFKLQISSSSLGALVYIILISFFWFFWLKGEICSFF